MVEETQVEKDREQLARDEADEAKKPAPYIKPDPSYKPAPYTDRVPSQVQGAVGAISHPSVAAIVPAIPGGPAGPDQDNLLIHARPFTGEPPQVVKIPAQHAVIPPIPKIPVVDGDVVKPVAQEQLERSEQNERDGLQNWAMNNDDRRRPETVQTVPGGVVPGVGFNPVPKGSA